MRTIAPPLLALIVTVVAPVTASETLDTLLPPPSWLRRHADDLQLDDATKHRIEQRYQEKEPGYHRLKYRVERLSGELYEVLSAEDIDGKVVTSRVKSLLEAENELKLYQVDVRLSVLSELTADKRLAARKLARSQPPPENWRGGIAGKVEQVRELAKRLVAAGGSTDEVEKRMREVDDVIASGRVTEGMRMLDEVIERLTKRVAN